MTQCRSDKEDHHNYIDVSEIRGKENMIFLTVLNYAFEFDSGQLQHLYKKNVFGVRFERAWNGGIP